MKNFIKKLFKRNTTTTKATNKQNPVKWKRYANVYTAKEAFEAKWLLYKQGYTVCVECYNTSLGQIYTIDYR